jgi:hypothetical protein
MTRLLMVSVYLAVLLGLGIAGYRLAREQPQRFESCRWEAARSS